MVFDDILDYLGEGWDMLLDGISYLISFEWVGDAGEFFGSMFENISELSITGLAFGILGAGIIYYLRGSLLTPFTQYMGTFTGLFWTIVTYIGCFAGGYFVGKHFEND